MASQRIEYLIVEILDHLLEVNTREIEIERALFI